MIIAPVLGDAILTLGGTWRTVFWFLVGFGLLMMIAAVVFVPEALLPPAPMSRPPVGVRS